MAAGDIYRALHARSLADPEGFWLEQAREIAWTKAPTRALDPSRAPFYRWFPDGELNTCHNALDRHVEAGHGARKALIYDSPVTGTQRTYSYAELRDAWSGASPACCRRSAWRRATGYIIYMPMVPEAVFAMLACARLGAIHSVVFGGFAPTGAGDPHRRRDAQPLIICPPLAASSRARRPLQAAARPGDRQLAEPQA